MTTTEKNKIIAEFMGYEIQKDPTERFFGRYKQPLGAWTKEIDLAFHHDWNWLMEVVEKIFKTAEDENIEYKTECSELLQVVKDAFYAPQKENVYNCCLDFINWYNEQKK